MVSTRKIRGKFDKEDDKEGDSVRVAPSSLTLRERTTSGICESSAQSTVILLLHLKPFPRIGNFHRPILLRSETMLEHIFLLSKLWPVFVISTQESFSLYEIFTIKGERNLLRQDVVYLTPFSTFCKSFKRQIYGSHLTSLMDMNNLRACFLLLSHLLIILRCIQTCLLSIVLIRLTSIVQHAAMYFQCGNCVQQILL